MGSSCSIVTEPTAEELTSGEHVHAPTSPSHSNYAWTNPSQSNFQSSQHGSAVHVGIVNDSSVPRLLDGSGVQRRMKPKFGSGSYVYQPYHIDQNTPTSDGRTIRSQANTPGANSGSFWSGVPPPRVASASPAPMGVAGSSSQSGRSSAQGMLPSNSSSYPGSPQMQSFIPDKDSVSRILGDKDLPSLQTSTKTLRPRRGSMSGSVLPLHMQQRNSASSPVIEGMAGSVQNTPSIAASGMPPSPLYDQSAFRRSIPLAPLQLPAPVALSGAPLSGGSGSVHSMPSTGVSGSLFSTVSFPRASTVRNRHSLPMPISQSQQLGNSDVVAVTAVFANGGAAGVTSAPHAPLSSGGSSGSTELNSPFARSHHRSSSNASTVPQSPIRMIRAASEADGVPPHQQSSPPFYSVHAHLSEGRRRMPPRIPSNSPHSSPVLAPGTSQSPLSDEGLPSLTLSPAWSGSTGGVGGLAVPSPHPLRASGSGSLLPLLAAGSLIPHSSPMAVPGAGVSNSKRRRYSSSVNLAASLERALSGATLSSTHSSVGSSGTKTLASSSSFSQQHSPPHPRHSATSLLSVTVAEDSPVESSAFASSTRVTLRQVSTGSMGSDSILDRSSATPASISWIKSLPFRVEEPQSGLISVHPVDNLMNNTPSANAITRSSNHPSMNGLEVNSVNSQLHQTHQLPPPLLIPKPQRASGELAKSLALHQETLMQLQLKQQAADAVHVIAPTRIHQSADTHSNYVQSQMVQS
jgi:hypothetical protein